MSRTTVYIVARRKDGNPVEYLRVVGVAQYPEWTVNLKDADQMTVGRAAVVQGAFGGTSFPFDGDIEALKRRIEAEFGRDTIPPRRFGDYGAYMAEYNVDFVPAPSDRVDALAMAHDAIREAVAKRLGVEKTFEVHVAKKRPSSGLAFLASNSIYGKFATPSDRKR